MTEPPETERDPVTETRHGESVIDPYRWLEGDGEAVADWERRQNEYTDGVVDTDYRASLRERLSAVAAHTTYHVPNVAGGRYFQRIEAPDADQPRLTVRDARDADPRTLVDPADLGETTALQWYVPGPDGERVLYGLTDAGTEQYNLRVLDVDGGEVVDRVDGVGRCADMMVGWLDDGFYYTRSGTADEGGQLEKAIRYREVGGEDRLVTDDIPEARWPTVVTDGDSVAVVALGELGADVELYALDDGLDPVVTDADASFQPLVHAGRVYLLTNHDADRFRVLAVEADAFADADGLAAFEEVVPASDDVLADIAPAGDGLALHRLRDAASAVTLHDADGTERHELALPDHSGIPRDGFTGSAETDEALFRLGGFDRPTGVVHADAGPDAGPDDWWVQQAPTLPEDLDPRADLDLTVERRWAESADGTAVPVYVVHRADLDSEAPPTVLYSYGGFRIPLLPELDPYRLPFLADGGVYAQVCARGGLEFGESWHDAGAGAEKERTFEDVEAAAELLVEEYTTTDRLAAWGGSNGGLTVGAVLTRRPDLFGAAVSNVPLLDMLRFHRFLLGAAWTAEYGSPEDPAAFETLRSYSPYHNVRETDYPATLFTTAAGDTRVHPAHARKMTARMQAATTGDAPVCFRSHDDAGHGVGTPTALEVEQAADKWAFVARALDLA